MHALLRGGGEMSFADQDPDRWRLLAQVALGMLLASAIVLRREFATVPAAWRVNIPVAGPATSLLPLIHSMIEHLHSGLPDCLVWVDPLRIVHEVITSVSLPGAGNVIPDRQTNALSSVPLARPAPSLPPSGSGRGRRSGCLSTVPLYVPGLRCAA